MHIGSENIVHRIFCEDRIFEKNTNFTDARAFTGIDGRPNLRQSRLIKIYEIICRNIEDRRAQSDLTDI